MDKHILDILTDYQISSFGKVTHTELSRALKDSISHDKFTRFLSGGDFTGKQLWEYVKPTVREVEQEDALIAVDDSVAEKEYSDENELITWHSDLTQTFQQIITIYEKRWKVEEYHKSLKSNVALCGSPAHTVRTQANHVFTCLTAFIKLEKMKVNKKLNHFAMKAILYTKAMEKALTELKKLKAGTQLKLNFA